MLDCALQKGELVKAIQALPALRKLRFGLLYNISPALFLDMYSPKLEELVVEDLVRLISQPVGLAHAERMQITQFHKDAHQNVSIYRTRYPQVKLTTVEQKPHFYRTLPPPDPIELPTTKVQCPHCRQMVLESASHAQVRWLPYPKQHLNQFSTGTQRCMPM